MSVASDILEQARDKKSGAISVDAYREKCSAEGRLFSIAGNTGAVAAAGTYYLFFKTPVITSGKQIRLLGVRFSSVGNTLLAELYSGVTINSAGTAVLPKNNNHESVEPSAVTASYGGSVTAEGTLCAQASVATGGLEGFVPAARLKGNTYYSVKFTNAGAVTDTVGYYSVEFSEEVA